MEALEQATIKVIAVIAEGVPEKNTKQMIAYARANNKVLIGPATVGGVQARPGGHAGLLREMGASDCARDLAGGSGEAAAQRLAAQWLCSRQPGNGRLRRCRAAAHCCVIPPSRPHTIPGWRVQDRGHRGHAGQHHRVQAVPPRQRRLCVQVGWHEQ